MYQECSIRVNKVTDSLIFCDKTENTSLFMEKYCKQQEGRIILG